MARSRTYSGLLALLFGGLFFGIKIRSPRVQAIAGSDLLALIGIGMCFGAALILLLDKVLPRSK